MYSTIHDVLVVCDAEGAGIHPGYLRPGMTVLDLAAGWSGSDLARAAQARGCAVVSPRAVLLHQLARQVRLITRKDVPSAVLEKAVAEVLVEE
jgi:shikimate 5-dehydrogenase